MAYVKVEALAACVDCVQIIANGEITALPDDGEAHALKMREHYGAGLMGLVLDGGEASFRKGPCDICGSTLAGDFESVSELAGGWLRMRMV